MNTILSWLLTLLASISMAAPPAGAAIQAATGLPTPPIPSFSPETQAQREAALLRKEGDRFQEEGKLKEAREKWLAALDAYRRSGYKAGEPEALFRLGSSYQAEAALDVQKQKLALVYTIQAQIATSEHLESILQEEPRDPSVYQQANALLKQASDRAAAGDCVAATPLFSQAGEASGKAGWAKGEVGSLAGRLRCLLKSDDFMVLAKGMSTGMQELPALFKKFKPQTHLPLTVRYLKAIEEDQLGNLKDAESDYRKVLRESQAPGDSVIVARTNLDLGAALVRLGNLAEAEACFRHASDEFLALQGQESQRNQAAALQNLASVELATGRNDAAINDYKKGLELWKILDEKAREVESLRALSSAFRQKGDNASAEAALAEAEKLEGRPVAKPQADGPPGTDPSTSSLKFIPGFSVALALKARSGSSELTGPLVFASWREKEEARSAPKWAHVSPVGPLSTSGALRAPKRVQRIPSWGQMSPAAGALYQEASGRWETRGDSPPTPFQAWDTGPQADRETSRPQRPPEPIPRTRGKEIRNELERRGIRAVEENHGRDATLEAGRPISVVLLAGGVLFTLNPRAQAQREATLWLAEGDRLLQAGNLRQAREKWTASVEAFKRASNRQGVAQCYKRLGDSYIGEAMFNSEKVPLAAGYYSQAVTEQAKEVEDAWRRNDSHLDDEELRKAGLLLDAASLLIASRGCTKALPMLSEARRLYQHAGFAYGEVRSLNLKGRCDALGGDLRSALATSTESFAILAALPVSTPPSELALKAEVLLLLDKQAEALALYQEVLCRYEEVKDIGGIAGTLHELGAVQFSMGYFTEAELSLSRAFGLLYADTQEDDWPNEAAIHHNLGAVYAATGRSREAVTELRLALSLWRDLGEPGWEVPSLSALGVALGDQGDFPAALAALDDAEKLQAKLPPNQELEGDLLNNRGKVYRSQGRYQEALDFFEKAEALYRPLSVRLKEAQVLTNIGTVEEALGHFSKAMSSFDRAGEIVSQLGTTSLGIKLEINKADTLFEGGEYQAAIRIYLDLLQETNSSNEEQVSSAIHNNLGVAYLQLGDTSRAQPHFEQALDAALRIGNREGVASALANRGQFNSHAGLSNLAEVDTRKALQIWRDLDNDVMANRMLGNLGWQALSGKFSEENLQAFQKGLESSRRAGLAADSLRFSLLLGAGCLQRGDFAGAIEHVSQALAEADQMGDSIGQYVGRTMLMESHYRQGDSSASLRDLGETVTGLDRWQRGLTLSELKGSFLAQFFEVYALGVLLNAEIGRPVEAFNYSEQARGKAFRDQIGNQRIAIRQGADAKLIQREGELRAQLAHLGEAIQKEKASVSASMAISDRQGSLEKAREEAQSEYGILLSRLKLANPEYAALVSVNALSLREIQQQVLDEHTTLIEYFVPDPPGRGSSTRVFAWVIDRNHLTMVRLSTSSSDLENHVKYFRYLIESRNALDGQAVELYRDLFAPLAPHIRYRNLIIVPHGVLHFLPFAALWDEQGRRYLGDTYALSYAPSATILKFARAKKARAVGPILAAGDPDGSLPQAATEAQAVSLLYGSAPLIGRAATKGAVMSRAGQAGILHLAAHADLNQLNPLFTRIKLAPEGEQGGDLEMHEVFGLDLSRTGLVVLSACQTQLGKLSAGDELEGLTRAFLYAGTPAVMSSLWKVEDDDSTAFLMTQFYSHLRHGAGRAESLRLAQIETRKRFPLPYQWAAFVLTGDGR